MDEQNGSQIQSEPGGTGCTVYCQTQLALGLHLQQRFTMTQAIATQRAAIRPRQRDEERVFKKDTHWFFKTREGDPKGPFIDKQHAYWALAKYIRQQCSFR